MNPVLPRLACLLVLAAIVVPGRAADLAPPAPRPFISVALANPRAIAVDRTGDLFVVELDSATVRRLTAKGTDTTFATENIKSPFAVAVDRTGTVFVSDADNNTLYKISAAGTAVPLPAVVPAPGFNILTSLVVDAAGNVFVTDNNNAAIRKVAPDGTVTTFAGKVGEPGSADGTGGAARFTTPRGLAIDPAGNLYVADEGNANIRKITPAGVVTTLAGLAGVPGSQNGTGSNARFAAPRALATDAAGNVYVADTDNNLIRKITPAGVTTTLAGSAGAPGNADGTGPDARFSEPRGIAVDASGLVFVADTGNNAIRQVTPAGVVTTIVAARR